MLDPRSHLGICLYHSPTHAGNIILVLNPKTGLVFPQFHIVFDNEFSTVSSLHKGEYEAIGSNSSKTPKKRVLRDSMASTRNGVTPRLTPLQIAHAQSKQMLVQVNHCLCFCSKISTMLAPICLFPTNLSLGAPWRKFLWHKAMLAKMSHCHCQSTMLVQMRHCRDSIFNSKEPIPTQSRLLPLKYLSHRLAEHQWSILAVRRKFPK